jgi:hypothetical protein
MRQVGRKEKRYNPSSSATWRSEGSRKRTQVRAARGRNERSIRTELKRERRKGKHPGRNSTTQEASRRGRRFGKDERDGR